MINKRIGFIGCGNIANAIIGGSVNSGYIKTKDLVLFDTDKNKTMSLISRGAQAVESVKELVANCDFIFLTVKPQVFESVLSEIGLCENEKCFISVAAGITVGYIKSYLGVNAHVIRVMPNTPLMYSKGSTAMVRTEPVTDSEYEFAKGIFECSGVTVDVSEDKINLITAISGSSPAYVMEFAKGIIDYAVANGLERESAEKLVLQVFEGTAHMVKCSDSSIDVLIKNVTSPNGTTEAGLRSLSGNNFGDTISECLERTVLRAKELTK